MVPGQLFEEEVLEAADLHLVLLLLLQQLRLAQHQLGLVVLQRGRQQLAAESGPRGGEVDGGDGGPGGNCIKIGLPGKSILRDYRARLSIGRKVLKVMFWEVPPAGGPLLLLPTAQAGWWNSKNHYLQNLATDRQPRSACEVNF